ncbi:MAG TPA: FlgD immunoglobulin-like domain containing protein [Candidatus Udaeobacter sp.]|jgi:hypothetical protein|nr:FlgD immunoglobulin-like domain containing protein [Candidatus Udaeobacter sp.]
MHSVSPRFTRRATSRFASAAGLTLFLMLAAALARAQCTISGPDVMCAGGSAQLCGSTEGVYQYSWSGPNGFTLVTNDPCITVTTAGTYSLTIRDYDTGFTYGPCDHTVADAATASCSITGSTSGCVGTSLQLCGPAGNFAYQWSGPNGFADTSACIQAAVAGLYSLAMTDRTSGCSIPACEQNVSFTTCSTDHSNCPRTARFWAAQCAGGSGTLTPDQLLGVAGCVDTHCDVFSWSSAVDGFCAVLNPTHPTLRDRAKRQMAALGANVCAGSMTIIASTGAAIGLDAATPIGSTTIGGWMSDADERMVALEGASLRDKSVRAAYRDIIRHAWNMNHGHDIGAVCTSTPHVLRHSATQIIGAGGPAGQSEPDANAEDTAEPLAVELGDDMPELSISRISPNPAVSQATIAYELDAVTSQPVSIGVYDLAGRHVRDLFVGVQAPGLYVLQWDGRDDSGRSVPGGVYFVRGRAGSQPVQTRLTIVR